MDAAMESDCAVLEERFQNVVSDLKSSLTGWEDFTLKASRLHTALKSTAAYSTAFLESFQRLADCTTSTRGATRDIGSAMTRLCLRHRNIDGRLKGFTAAILDSLVVPLQERMEEWRRAVVTLDREHSREYKKAQQEIRKAATDAQRLQKKVKKGKLECRAELERTIKEGNERLATLHGVQQSAVKAAMVEERGRLCLFVSCLKPVMDEEIAMLTEVTHVQEILHSLCMLAGDPESMHMSATANPLPGGSTARHESAVKRSESFGGSRQDDLTSSKLTLSAGVMPGSPGSGGSMTSSGGSVGSSAQLYSPTHLTQLQQQQAQQQQAQQQQGQWQLQQQRAQSQIFAPKLTSDVDDTGGSSQTLVLSDSQSQDIDRPPYQEPDFTARILKRQKDLNSSHAADRPHTISSAYERSFTRPTITADTYLPMSGSSGTPQQQGGAPPYLRTQSYMAAYADGGHYAVPCIVPNSSRRQSSGVKVADIYARPSLIPAGSKGAYRSLSNRPLPVATPTVPDFEPAFPAAGYVNMNQLASLAIQQQLDQGGGQKKDAGAVSASDQAGKRDATNRPVSEFGISQREYLFEQSRGGGGARSRNIGREGFVNNSEIDLNQLAERLAYASQMSGVDKYCTLTHQSRAAAVAARSASTQFFPGYAMGGARDASVPADWGRDGGARSHGGGERVRAGATGGEHSSTDEWESDRDSPVFS